MGEPLRIGFIGAAKQAQAAHLRHFTVGFHKRCDPATRAAVDVIADFRRTGAVEIFRDGGKDGPSARTLPVLPRECAMDRPARLFLAMVRGEATPLCDAGQARECMDIIRQWTRWPEGA